jgi:hypothetical protein
MNSAKKLENLWWKKNYEFRFIPKLESLRCLKRTFLMDNNIVYFHRSKRLGDWFEKLSVACYLASAFQDMKHPYVPGLISILFLYISCYYTDLCGLLTKINKNNE